MLTQVLFTLIRSAVCSAKIPIRMIEQIKSCDISEIFHIGIRHDIAGIISEALYKNGLYSFFAAESEGFKKFQLKTFYKSTEQEYELKRIKDALEEAGIKFIALKGAETRRFYPEPYMRTSCDIDILISKSDCGTAISALTKELEYTEKRTRTLHDYHLFSQNGVHLELHYTLLEDGRIPKADKLLKNVWQYTVQSGERKYEYKLTPEMFMFYHIVHMVKHIFGGGCGIRPFVDLWLLQDKMPFDSEKLCEMLEEASLLRFYETAVELSNVWMTDTPHTDATLILQKYVLNGGVYGTGSQNVAISAVKNNGKFKKVLHSMFLSPERLMVVYPSLEAKPYLFPIYQVRRWFRMLNSKKRKKAFLKIKTVYLTSENDICFTEKLLKQLGLDGV